MKMKLTVELEMSDNEEASVTLQTLADMFKEDDDDDAETKSMKRMGFLSGVVAGTAVETDEPTDLPLEPIDDDE